MKISTFSIVTGSAACNARCPFCVSHMTPPSDVELKPPEVNWRNFKKACRLAQLGGTTTVMFTGKGEPTLFPDQISDYLMVLKGYDFPLIELQTNAIVIGDNAMPGPPRENGGVEWNRRLEEWYRAGLTTIAISVVHWENEFNRRIYTPYRGRKDYPDLRRTVQTLHDNGFSVRLAVTMLKGYVDSQASVRSMIDFAREQRVEQLTLRPVARPDKSRDFEASSWVDHHAVDATTMTGISNMLHSADDSTLLMELPHGARVYDVDGQNVCLTDCLTLDASKPEELRNLIFFPDGSLRYAWQYEGARLL